MTASVPMIVAPVESKAGLIHVALCRTEAMTGQTVVIASGRTFH